MNTYFKSLIVGLSLVILGSGCVVVPALKFGAKPETGVKLKQSEIEFIVPGRTKRAEVVDRLGTDFRQTPRSRAVAYSWEIPGGNVILVVCSHAGAGAWSSEVSRWRAVFIDFDPNGVVTRKAIVRLKGSKSLDDQLDQWAAGKP